MFTFLRNSLFLFLVLPLTVWGAPDSKTPAAKPVVPVQAAPAFLDVVTFMVRTDGDDHKMVVTTGPGLLRIDEATDGYSIIYDQPTDHYTGLEHRNYTYWEFSWPEVRHAVQSSKRFESHLEELNAEGVNNDSTSTNSNAPVSSSSVPDNAGYVWKPTTDKKRIAGLDCVRWTGDSVNGEGLQAWCYNGPLPKVQAAMDNLRKINEPIALVPVRVLVPSLVFPIYDTLTKGGVTPVLISWGGKLDKNQFAFVSAKTEDGKMSLFTIPKLYMRTTLITMDGMIDQNDNKGEAAPDTTNHPALPSP